MPDKINNVLDKADDGSNKLGDVLDNADDVLDKTTDGPNKTGDVSD